MGQKFIAANPSKYAIGKQTDVAIKIEDEATSASYFLSLSTFEAPNAPEPIMIEDAIGNRGTNSYSIIGERSYPFTMGGMCDINKLAKLIYLATGEVVSVQDGSTGAWKHVFSMLNNVILPKFTVFFSLGAEGYRRMTGCRIGTLTVTVSDSEATFTIEGMAEVEDDTVNSSTDLGSLTITDVEYQEATGLTRYTFSGSPDLSSVANGDVLVTETATLSAANAGSFIIVDANDGSDYIDVLNPERTSTSGDQTGISAASNTIKYIVTPVYPDPAAVLLRRHSGLLDAADLTALNALTDADADGVRNFTFTINNNLGEIREGAFSPNPAEIIAKNINGELTFTQIMKQSNADKAKSYREEEISHRAFRIRMKDADNFLGSSSSYVAQIDLTVPKGHAIATRANMHSNDELIYDWTVNVLKEQLLTLDVYNTLSDTELIA